MESNTSLVVSQPNQPHNPVIHTLFIHKIKVVVLDYHSLYLDGFCTFLNLNGCNVIGRSRTGTELIRLLTTNELPDLTIINYKTTKPKTLIVARVLKRKYPSLKVIINTQYTSKLLQDELDKIGVEGLILKTEYDKKQIIEVLLATYNGNTTS